MPRETSKDVESVFQATAAHKANAPTARRAGELEASESPREVYLSACAQISAGISAEGFRYVRSAQQCKREVAAFAQQISFQSSHNNVAGVHVRLWMHATASSKQLQAWRAARGHSQPVSSHVAGGMVHRLNGTRAMVEWELADPSDRNATIEDAVAFIHTDVLPYFRQFERPSELIDSLAESEVGAFDLVPSVEFALCFGDAVRAQAVLDRFIRERPDLSEAVALAEAEGRPIAPYGPASYAEAVAFVRRSYNLH